MSTAALLSILLAASAVEPGVSWTLAQERAANLGDVRYALTLSLPEGNDAPIKGTVVIRAKLKSAEQPLVLDFAGAQSNVASVKVGGRAIEAVTSEGHLSIPAKSLRRGENVIEVAFTAGDGPLNRNPGFLYTLFVPGRASEAFPSFDQPNLKARFTLSLEMPEKWRAVSNGKSLKRVVRDGRAVESFAQTLPISTYLFSFAAGEFQIESAVRGGKRYRMFHRETDAEKVRRNRDAIFDLHHTARICLERYTAIPYPFGKFDFVLIPSFQYRGMEHPGAVLYRAEKLFLDETATQVDELDRASLIAHETAHMWFGDLVTMNWFDDVWTKEVFANFMAAKIVNPSFPRLNHELRFLLAHHPKAYEVDRSEGANPIRQPLENLREAGSLYGAIIYQKAPIMMRQLEAMVGPEIFRAGMRTYLKKHAFKNATWPALIAILDAKSPRDLRAWSRVWVEEPGRPILSAELRKDEEGRIAELAITQRDPRGKGRSWPQRVDVGLVYADRVERIAVELEGERTVVPAAKGKPLPELVMPDAQGMGYGELRLSAAELSTLASRVNGLSDPLVRGVAWLTLWDGVLEQGLSPEAFLDAARVAIEREEEELNLQRVLDMTVSAFWRLLPENDRAARAPALEKALWERLAKSKERSVKSALFGAYRSIAVTEPGVKRLRQVWSGEAEVPGLPLAEPDFTALALELAVRDVDGAKKLLEQQHARIDNPDRKARFAFLMAAVSPDAKERDAFFARLAKMEHRRRETWIVDALPYLHHPLRAHASKAYVRASLELMEELQRTGDIFFPKGWMDGTLGGHASSDVAKTVREFLDARPDYPHRLRGKILQAADGLFRAAAIREAPERISRPRPEASP